MENQALLKNARMVHRRWETMRVSIAIILSYTAEKPIEETLALKWDEIDVLSGRIKKWDNVSPEALALVLGAKEYEIHGSEYVFPDRWGMMIGSDKFDEIRERIDEEAGLSNFLRPNCPTVQ